ncbi:hypothetical protein J6590_019892 [Homalodisca vitripennis]|nr:hypothetical protein J6590_019892 [Homalodisca vitripennis]
MVSEERLDASLLTRKRPAAAFTTNHRLATPPLPYRFHPCLVSADTGLTYD